MLAKKYVVRRTQGRHIGKLLINHLNPQFLGLCHGQMVVFDPIHQDCSRCGRLRPGDGFNQSGLPCPVFPDNGVYLSGTKIKRNIIQSLNTGKFLTDVLYFQNCFLLQREPSFPEG